MENKDYYYFIVLYKDNVTIPIFFKTWEKAEEFILKNNLHAYITIKMA